MFQSDSIDSEMGGLPRGEVRVRQKIWRFSTGTLCSVFSRVEAVASDRVVVIGSSAVGVDD